MTWNEEQIKAMHKKPCCLTTGFDTNEAALKALADILSHEEDPDSFSVSPFYYAFTGRKGFGLFKSGKTFVPFCLHPNLDKQLLIFPPRGEKNYGIIWDLLNNLHEPKISFQLARFKLDDINQLNRARSSKQKSFLVLTKEKILDWHFPVHILSTESVSRAQGSSYAIVRNRVKQPEKYGVTIERFAPSHLNEIMGLVTKWAFALSRQEDPPVDVAAPYATIFHLSQSRSLKTDGLVFFVKGKLQAAALWDVSQGIGKTANLYVNICAPGFAGLSEYVIKSVADLLFAQNIPFLNLGGSEEVGLDRFKRKFAPALSLSLFSIQKKSLVDKKSFDTPSLNPYAFNKYMCTY